MKKCIRVKWLNIISSSMVLLLSFNTQAKPTLTSGSPNGPEYVTIDKAYASSNRNLSTQFYADSSSVDTIPTEKIKPTLWFTSHNKMLVNRTLIAAVTTTAIGEGSMLYTLISGSGLATVNQHTGLVNALKPGTVILTASRAEDAYYDASVISQVITIGNAAARNMVSTDHKSDYFSDPLVENSGFDNFNTGGVMPMEVGPQTSVGILTAYSPNGDGVGDSFYTNNIAKNPNNELMVINSDGEVVFKAYGDGNSFFDGKSSSGIELAEGIYYYMLSYYEHNKMNLYKGYFKLAR